MAVESYFITFTSTERWHCSYVFRSSYTLCIHMFILLWLVACSFEKEAYEIDENDGPLQLKLKLNKSPTTEINLQVYDLSNTANGE